jgi:type 1 fimbria pilin
MADDTSHLVVSGVISPASCGVSLGGVSKVQLGTIKVSDFVADKDLVLEEKDAALSITCEGAAAKFWLKASDATTEGAYQPGISHYGLGFNAQGGKPNGYFTLSIDKLLVRPWIKPVNELDLSADIGFSSDLGLEISYF